MARRASYLPLCNDDYDPRETNPLLGTPRWGDRRSPLDDPKIMEVVQIRLARGEPYAQVSRLLGYVAPSDFVAIYRIKTGEHPNEYAQRQREAQTQDREP